MSRPSGAAGPGRAAPRARGRAPPPLRSPRSARSPRGGRSVRSARSVRRGPFGTGRSLVAGATVAPGAAPRARPAVVVAGSTGAPRRRRVGDEAPALGRRARRGAALRPRRRGAGHRAPAPPRRRAGPRRGPCRRSRCGWPARLGRRPWGLDGDDHDAVDAEVGVGPQDVAHLGVGGQEPGLEGPPGLAGAGGAPGPGAIVAVGWSARCRSCGTCRPPTLSSAVPRRRQQRPLSRPWHAAILWRL